MFIKSVQLKISTNQDCAAVTATHWPSSFLQHCFVLSSEWLHIPQGAFQEQSVTHAWCCWVALMLFASAEMSCGHRWWKHEHCLEQPQSAKVMALMQWARWNLGIRATFTFTFRAWQTWLHGRPNLRGTLHTEGYESAMLTQYITIHFCIISINSYYYYTTDISVANLLVS